MKKTAFTIAVALVGTLVFTSYSVAGTDRNILWDIISNCIDTSAKDYCAKCRSPRMDMNCNACRNLTTVWAESPDFVVVRDTKSCDCQVGFIHALAIPRSKVTGFEDPQRPDGIWQFAWQTGIGKLKMKEDELALAVNPKSQRSQDQLHVHIVRVMRDKLPQDRKLVARVDSLDQVWEVAALRAAELMWKDYGVLVTRAAEGDFLVVIDQGSPEFDYTVAQCGGPRTM